MSLLLNEWHCKMALFLEILPQVLNQDVEYVLIKCKI